MLTFLPTPANIVAFTVDHRLTSADLAAVMDRIDAALAAHDMIHFFADIRQLDALEVSGLGAHLARAMPLFGKLRRFGRVAVVSDQAWLRGLTRVESAVLPGIAYRVFDPDRRDEALAWALGKLVD